MTDPGQLITRAKALTAAADLVERYTSDPAATVAHATARRVMRRIVYGHDRTVVGLVGPTGVGKSSLFNALAGQRASPTSELRPTTDRPHGHVFGGPAHKLLDWYRVSARTSGPGPQGWESVVLLDLPDLDSLDLTHRETVERVVEHLDFLIWVVDPEKYADVRVQEAVLRPLVEYGLAVQVVINKADLIPAEERDVVRDHAAAVLAKLLHETGRTSLDPLLVSAGTGIGQDQLRQRVAAVTADRERVLAPLARDLQTAADQLEPSTWMPTVDEATADQALADLIELYDLDTVMAARAGSRQARRRRMAAWPPLRPLLGVAGSGGAVVARDPDQVTATLDELADGVVGEHHGPWASAARRGMLAGAGDLTTAVNDQLDQDDPTDRQDGSTSPARARGTGWPGLVGEVQNWLMVATVAIGGLVAWTTLVGDTGPQIGTRQLILPTGTPVVAALVGAVALGLVLTAVGWLLAGRAHAAELPRHEDLLALVERAVDRAVMRRAESVLRARNRVVALTDLAAGRPDRRP
ncbi:GTPase domain-containing protein [Euzebya tangerina]|uniref:GTPase domain-containing protein n=1 Tax=Euzebya tangerina TaxID=591198 RepID=UPI000E31DCB4|nr:GTPase domain-containing protein [Euzebya tangerina]